MRTTKSRKKNKREVGGEISNGETTNGDNNQFASALFFVLLKSCCEYNALIKLHE